MLVFIQQNLVILSVPKTGSTALQMALRETADVVYANPPQLKHMNFRRYCRFVRPMIERLCSQTPETVAVMREPRDWLGSWYRYRQRPFLEGKPNSTKTVSFEEFVTVHMQNAPPVYARVGRQSRFLRTAPDGSSVTHLFRYEDQSALLSFLEGRLDRKIALERYNTSPPGDLTLSAKTEAMLEKHYSADFDLYKSL